MSTAIQPPQRPPQKWRDVAIEKSEFITDAWEVTKAYLGRAAEWVLFLCMVINVVQILPGVAFLPVVNNIVLGLQIVMLDIGGFSLMTMADHAKSQGKEKAAHHANVTAWVLITIMILTLVLFIAPILFPTPHLGAHQQAPAFDLATFAKTAENVLILIRIVMTVIYGKVIHGLRSGSSHLPVVVQDRLSELFSQIELHLAGVQYRFKTEGQEVRSHLRAEMQEVQDRLRAEVQQALQEHAQAVLTGVQNTLTEHLIGVQEMVQQDTSLDLQEVVQQAIQVQATQLVESLNEVRREVRTTITEARSISRSTAESTGTITTAKSPHGGTHSRTTRGIVPSTVAVPGTVITCEDTGTETTPVTPIPIELYIKEQIALNRIPSLNEIVQACRCSKTTASQARQKLIPSSIESVQ